MLARIYGFEINKSRSFIKTIWWHIILDFFDKEIIMIVSFKKILSLMPS